MLYKNRTYSIEAFTDKLMKGYSKSSGYTLKFIVNSSICSFFMPTHIPTLSIEANYLAQQFKNNEITTEDYGIALERSVLELRDKPIKDATILAEILSNFISYSSGWSWDNDDRNDYVIDLYNTCIDKIKENDSNYTGEYKYLSDVGVAILKHWDSMWNVPGSYEVLADIFMRKPKRGFRITQVIGYLKVIEDEVIKEYVANKSIA